ncbi:MAG: hypothetical protein KDA28_05325, partial [Phycisphaerales bacterium]|nr:hypothetical protein [Phycisphaerales bacterium]
LATPWVLVTGSMAYNEMTMILLGAGALLAALDTEAPSWRTGALVAFLTGCACGAKPTAIFMIAPPVAVMLLTVHPPKRWPVLVGVGTAVGLATLAPWLIRNWVHLGNPVFPHLTSVFGTAHWTDEQVARFASGHRFDGSFAARVSRLILPERRPRGGFEQFGIFHAQWFCFFPLAIIALTVTGIWTPCRRRALALASGFALQIIAWLLFTHVQSRFLLPLVLTGSPMIGLLASRLLPVDRRAMHLRAVFILLVATLVTMNAWVLMHFDNQHDHKPNALLVAGVPARTGAYARRAASEGDLPGDPWMRAQVRAPGTRLKLIGDATPLYMPGPLVYRTTWDTYDPSLEGIDMILVNFAEIQRFERIGWNDPALTIESIGATLRDLDWTVVAQSRTSVLLERPR